MEEIYTKNSKGLLSRKRTFLYSQIAIKDDCFAYKKREKECDCLTCLECKYGLCAFYKPAK